MSTQMESLSEAKAPLHTAAQIRVMVDMADYAESLLNRHVTVMEVGRWLDLLGSESECEKYAQALAVWLKAQGFYVESGSVADGRAAVAGSGGRMRFVG